MRKLFLIPILFAVQSCHIVGLTSDYSKLGPNEKAMIVDVGNFNTPTTDKIYKITGTELREEVNKQSKALVYTFTNGCTSENCKPMKIYEMYAKEHGYKLYLVMNGYGNLDETLQQRNAFDSPLYAIKSEAYRSRYRSIYGRLFTNELLQRPEKQEWNSSLYFFENGKLVYESYALPNG